NPFQLSNPPMTSSASPMKIGMRHRTTSSSKVQTVLQPVPGFQVYTAGRPPWFGKDGVIQKPFLIGICGGSASGKTTVAKEIIGRLQQRWVSLLSMDSYYREYLPEEKPIIRANNFNFDHPSAFDLNLLVETLKRLKQGKHVNVPIYDFTTHSRVKGKEQIIYGANVVIFEGILAFCDNRLLDLIDLKVFVDTDDDERLSRRLIRDIRERGRAVQGVLDQYERFVKPSFDEFIAPTRSKADIIVPRGGSNHVAIDLICRHVRNQLIKRGLNTRCELAEAYRYGDMDGHPEALPDNVRVLEQTQQVRHLHTVLRNRNTERDEFVFYANRLMRLLFEHALGGLPESSWQKVTVTAPDGSSYEGVRRATTASGAAASLVGVSVLRAGETMEPALAAVAKDVRLGKILIQTNPETREPELHYHRLPTSIAESQVILMDATVATGAAAMMAVRVLLDHDCPEQNITFCTLVASAAGVSAIAYAFPKLRLVTTAIDPGLSDAYYIEPGVGNFGDRYFGTTGGGQDDSGDETC
uniref:Uridine kinase n=2 Tax=Macrostomum lignano TaxID=282301 RepID=A0A1I8J4V9_9PLAT